MSFRTIVTSLVSILLLLPVWSARAEVPPYMTYQGKLTDAAGIILDDGSYSVTFKIYAASSGGTSLWNGAPRSVDLKNGLFSCLIGPLPEGLFADGEDRWLGITVGSDPAAEEISPRNRLTSVPFAYRALYADGSASAGGWLDDGEVIRLENSSDRVGISVNDPKAKLHVYGSPTESINAFRVDAGFPKSPYLVVDESGKIGLGTAVPLSTVHLRKNLSAITTTMFGSDDFVIEDPAPEIGLYATSGHEHTGAISFGRVDDGRLVNKWSLFRESEGDGLRFAFGNQNEPWLNKTLMKIDRSGRVGFGTDEPIAKFHLRSASLSLDATSLRWELMVIENFHSILGLYSRDIGKAGIAFGRINDGGSLVSKWGMVIDKNSAGNDRLRFTRTVGADITAGESFLCISNHGNVGIGTESPASRLTVKGNIELQSERTGETILELGEGLDYAEGFDVSSSDEVTSGMVLVIDPNNPGTLCMSTSAYDTRVAGIVAGANGLGSGVRLGAGRFDYDVALAGRVYCNVDASESQIKPGDLLTTSDVPGYAMKVTDYKKAQGAIIGKAMQNLEKGKKGHILVLVTLQ